jgi:bacterioferritin-associated ferredoxin
MYVCVCNAIRDSEIEALARKGARSADDVYGLLGVEVSCASCTEHIEELLETATAAQSAA